MQRQRITRADIEAFETTAGCLGCKAIRSGKRAQAHSGPCRVKIEERLKTTPEGEERSDRRSEVLKRGLSQRKLRETSEEERKSEVQQESWQYHGS